MPRSARNPLPQFMSSPDLGDFIATALAEYADIVGKGSAADFAGVTPADTVMGKILSNAADEIRRYHDAG